MNKAKYVFILSVLGIALAGCNQSQPVDPNKQYGQDPVLPDPKNFLVPPMKVPKGVGWQADQKPQVIQGLKIEKIADQLQHPRQLYTLPNGDVLVVEANSPGEEATTTPKQLIANKVKGISGKASKGGNKITLLRQQADGGWKKYDFLQNLHSPFGVQLIGNTLYVANTGNIMKYPYSNGATKIESQGEELTDLPNTVNHHWTKALLASPDGSKLYVGVGSNSNITENGLEIEYRRANILEVDVTSGASRIFASGLRNPTGIQWEPQTQKLWAIVNERDEIGDSLVPDYLTSVREKGFYGWPYSYYGQHIDQRVQPQRPDLVAKAIKPDYTLSSHVAPLGLWFATQNIRLTDQFKNGAFVSNHGSWDRNPLNGYDVIFIPFENGQPVGQPIPVVTGFYSQDQKKLYGAPVGLTEDKSGALLIADDVGNTIWRVSANN
ncbi:PQQ-dependent sugar dehydrogenase [Acinetobacter ihumii]|uniref:PQQ-dependent sugar dehydrogenase n=1 Tax=Acinetobacter ihumii TaxID=2483802 RepID=UPI0010320B1D|nr:sorbosone dehydrogenase family protein [Acinetobacter ihumii]